MKFKRMNEMTAEEIKIVFHIVFPYGELKRYDKQDGYITVLYALPSDGADAERRMDFLPDDIYIVGESEYEPPDGKPLSNGEVLYKYMQYMIAKGYSEYWLNNPYLENSFSS